MSLEKNQFYVYSCVFLLCFIVFYTFISFLILALRFVLFFSLGPYIRILDD